MSTTKLKVCATLVLITGVSLWGCSGVSDGPKVIRDREIVVATVDQSRITMGDLKKEILEVRGFNATLEVSGATREEIIKALQRLIRKTLIMEEARQMGVDVDEEEVKREIREIKHDYPEGTFGKLLLKEGIEEKVWEEKLKRTLLIEKASEIIKDRAAPATQKELYTYLANNKIRLRKQIMIPKRWHLKEFVFLTREDAEQARVLMENSDGERDEELLKSTNIQVTVYDLGFLAQKEIGKDYMKEVTFLEENQISEIVTLPSSHAIFRVMKIEPKHVKTKDDAIREIKGKISMQKREEYLSQWMQKRFNECTIKVNEAALGRLEGINDGEE